MDHYVMDYETLSNCFLAVFEHYKTDETHVFTIGKLRNDLVPMLDFFEENILNNQWHISFNGLAFDAQITQDLIVNNAIYRGMSGEAVAKAIYAVAQDTINRSNNREFAKYSEKKLSIKQIDIFKLNHWDNPAKRSSLKWIQCSMDWYNVQDMPMDHTESIDTVAQLQEVAKYCRNDVASTKAAMQLCTKEIALRGTLTKQYNIPLYSASEPRISKELFLHFLAKKTGVSKYELRQLRTFRSRIVVNDLILPYTSFEGVPVFQELLRNFRQLTIDPNQTKGGFKYSVKYRGMKTDFGLGGVHGAKRGLYESDEHVTIMSSDVVSYYPNLAIRNGWAPAQLPSDAFCELYEWFFDERKKIPKSDPRNKVYKLILNGTYGLSNDKHSFLYDPEFTMRITINGQLSLTMLYVMLAERIPGCVPLMQNTDGVEMIIPNKYKAQYLDICKEWEDLTQLKLEHDEYQKLIVPDVNNYIGVFKDQEVTKADFYKNQKDSPDNLFKRRDGKYYMAKTKCKGRFEFANRPLHKNKSFTVIPKALYYYYVHGVKPEDYILTNKNVFDFCGQTKARGDWKFMEMFIKDNEVHNLEVQKTMRYYVSKKGSKVVKCNKIDGRKISVEAGKWLQTTFNFYEVKDFEAYDIDPKFYLFKINKELTGLQPDLFSTQIKIEF